MVALFFFMSLAEAVQYLKGRRLRYQVFFAGRHMPKGAGKRKAAEFEATPAITEMSGSSGAGSQAASGATFLHPAAAGEGTGCSSSSGSQAGPGS